jgi:membrane protease YdiL (CAAX protease family)
VSAAATLRADPRAAAASAVVLAGVTALLARPFVAASPSGRTALFAASYLVIGLGALAAPEPGTATPARPSGRRTAALAAGLAAVAAGTFVAGTPAPSPWGAGALPLSVLAAVAEEALFRRAAYARLERFGAPVAVVLSAALFALVHVPAYGTTALPVDLGAGLLLSWQRWASGTWTVPAATHALANVVAVLR